MTRPTPFRFLDLPAEIRNKIYTHASTPEPIITLSHARLTPNTALGIFESSSNRPFQGLTQVCHQVRSEFLPLYRATAVQERVKVYDAIEYVKTFLREGDVYVGTIYLAQTRMEMWDKLRQKYLLALIEFCWDHEGLGYRFREEEDEQVEQNEERDQEQEQE